MTHLNGKFPCLLLITMAALLAVPDGLWAIELNRSFSNDMVLQRDKPVKIWGTAGKGAAVTVTFAGQEESTTADQDGRWVVTLKPMGANGVPQVLGVKSPDGTISLNNIVVGDVFLFARQSSIDVSLGSTPAGKQAAAALDGNKTYRFIQIKTSPSKTPLNNLKEDATSGWRVVDKQSALAMSAAAFYLGRDLVKDVGVPVGIVDLSMGYHFSAAWLSPKGLDLAVSRPEPGAADVKFEREHLPIDIEAWEAGDAGYVRGKEWKRKGKDTSGNLGKTLIGMSPIEMPHSPSVCYNAVIYPLRGLTVKGMLLQLGNDYPFVAFQRLRKIGKLTDYGELQKANDQSYDINKGGSRMTPNVLPTAVNDLRNSLGDESLPVAWIMPPGSDVCQYATHNREVREVQRRAQAESKAVALILPGAEHVKMSGQPADEGLLAGRCKQWVMGTFYGVKGSVSGPVFDHVEFGNGKGTVFFKSGTAEGLSASGDALKHFEMAADDGEFVPCAATIDGTSIKLTCDMESMPMYVRYGWSLSPIQGLVNSAGLPALPFTTDAKWEYNWWPDPAPVELPAEYHTPASKWQGRGFAVIDCGLEIPRGPSQPLPSHLGPTGLWAASFGPNLWVLKITPGSPADGKVFKDDLIYGINGADFGAECDDKYRQFATAITLAEAETGGGTITLNIRRQGKLIEVPIKLEFMGSYSATTPWNCEKSERIVKKAEEWMRNGLRPGKGIPQTREYMHGPFHTNALFLLASGNPKLQGLVRRYIRQELDQMDISKPAETGGIGWSAGYFSVLLGEYYHRTGDPTVLPYLEWMVDKFSLGQIQPPDGNPYKNILALTEEQVGAFRGGRRTPGTTMVADKNPPTGRTDYGLMPACDIPGVMGMVLTKEAGVKVDELVLSRALKHLNYKRAENGFILYAYTNLRIDKPQPIDPAEADAGMVNTMNGKDGTAAALFSLLDGYSKAVENCSKRCALGFNDTRHGHGGMWFNNYWTPIGAFYAGEAAYQHFMQGQQWWRELYRDQSGAVWQTGNSDGKGDEMAVGYVIHYVAPQKRLRMFGAPRSAFAANPPAYLKEALAAHHNRDYALAETLIQKELDGKAVPEADLPMVRHFLDAVQMIKKSIEYDLTYTEGLLKKGEYYLASLELPQLKMVVAPGNARLKAIAATLESKEGTAKVAALLAQAQREQKRGGSENEKAVKNNGKTWAQELASLDTLAKDGKITRSGKNTVPTFPENQWNRWRLRAIETISDAPEGWQKPDYDDSGWDEVTLPTAWPMGHVGMLRTTFEVKDVKAYESLQVRANVYKQRNMKIYLNGQLVAIVNNMRNTEVLTLTSYAMELLKSGRNSLAVITEHGQRWVDFGFRLEGRLKDESKKGK